MKVHLSTLRIEKTTPIFNDQTEKIASKNFPKKSIAVQINLPRFSNIFSVEKKLI